METTVGRVLLLLVSVAIAAMMASTMSNIALHSGLSREEIRGIALAIAASIGALLAIERYGKKFRGIK